MEDFSRLERLATLLTEYPKAALDIEEIFMKDRMEQNAPNAIRRNHGSEGIWHHWNGSTLRKIEATKAEDIAREYVYSTMEVFKRGSRRII
jgi:hypothetical protein